MTTNEEMLFVELALERGLVTPEQVDEIHSLKARLAEMGLAEHVADLMVKRGMIPETESQVLRNRVSPGGGKQQIEGYRLIERLGRGGMGSVYKALQVSMDRLVALKVLKASLTQDEQQVARLRREAQYVGKLQHPNIVRGLDFGFSGGFHYFAMEYVEGESVKQVLDSRGPMKEKDALRVVREVALALEHAHAEGIVHRDIKPGNILLGKDGSVKLTDYGLAKGPLEDMRLTQSGVTVGTPQYISPEQARGPSDVDIRTDIYSLGATLYHMVTGRPPYEGETLAHLIQQVLYEPYAPPRTLRRNLSPDTAFLIEKMLARRPRHRYQSPRELLADLGKIEKGGHIVPAGWQGDFESFHLRRRLRIAIAATVIVLLVGGAVSLFLNMQLEKTRRRQAETAAHEELMLLAGTPLTVDTLPELLRRHEELLAAYPGTEAAEEAGASLALLHRESRHLTAARDLSAELRDLRAKQEWAAALRALREFAEGLPEEESSLALDETRASIELLVARRDEAVSEDLGDLVRRLVERPPAEAVEALSGRLAELRTKAFLPDENPVPLSAAADLESRLSAALNGAAGHEVEARRLLGGPAPLDYRKVGSAIAAGRAALAADAGLKADLAALPPVWAEHIRAGFDRLEEEALAKNREDLERTLAAARALAGGNRYAEAIDSLGDLAERSLDPVVAEARGEQQRLAGLLSDAKTTLAEAFRAFLPAFAGAVGGRRWTAAGADLERLRSLTSLFVPNPYAGQIRAAEQLFATGQAVEQKFLEAVDGRPQIAEGLGFETVRVRPVHDVRVENRTVIFRAQVGGPLQSFPVEKVSVEDLRRECGLDPRDAVFRVVVGLFRLGELRALQNDRSLREQLAEIENEILAGREHPGVAPLAEELSALLRGERAAIEDRLRSDENAAQVRYDQAQGYLKARRWQDAYESLDLLLTDPRLSRTEFVKQREAQLRTLRDEAKAKLPSVRLGEYFGARSDHLAGLSVSAGYRAALLFDWEEEAEIERFRFTPGRIGILAVETPFVGPEPPAGGGGAATWREHYLRFFPPARMPEEGLDRHPLVLESPFLYSSEIAVEFRARWERPLALLVSVCGTNVAVLSDESRRENGRGVHIWQDADLSRPDRAVPDDLRATFIARRPEVLDGDASRSRYFGFEGNRWYRIRFTKGEKEAVLTVDGRTVHTERIGQYQVKTEQIEIRTWTPCDLDELQIEGTVDREWFARNLK